MSSATLLNLGCGTDIRRDGNWTNLDALPLPGVDIVHDFNKTPWPLKDEEFTFVLAKHVLEHVPHGSDGNGFLNVMEEIYRVLKPGGWLSVIAPHWKNSEYAWADPTHTRVLYPRTWSYFTDSNDSPSFYTHARFRLLHKPGTNYMSRFPGVPLMWRLKKPVEATYVLVKE